MRIAKVAKELNIGASTLIEHLIKNGFEVENKPTTKLTPEMYDLLLKEFQSEKDLKEKAKEINLGFSQRDDVEIKEKDYVGTTPPKADEDTDTVMIQNLGHTEEKVEEKKPEPVPEVKPAKVEPPKEVVKPAPKEEPKKPVEEEKVDDGIHRSKTPKLAGPKVVQTIDLDAQKPKKKAEPKAEAPVKDTPAPVEKVEKKEEPKEEVKPAAEVAKKVEEPKKEEVKDPNFIERRKTPKLEGPTIMGKIELKEEPSRKKPVASSSDDKPTEKKKRRRKRITKEGENTGRGRPRTGGAAASKSAEPAEITEKEIQDKIKATMAKLGGATKGKSARAKIRKAKKDGVELEGVEDLEMEKNLIQVTEFISVAELASLLEVTVPEIISTCMNLGTIVSINQRLDAEVIELVAGEFDFEVEFIGVDEETEEIIEEDDPKDLLPRAPIVTIMGHVDHGKTSLLDFIRNANVIAGEMGGITQHIGAYEVTTETGKNIAFLDTPGHEAFTAMRARGAKVTDIAVIVVSADDAVMPQTKEAISHAQAAGVPMVFAINKIDKDGADPERIKTQLAEMNLLVEDWGGKYQSQEISAKSGLNVNLLLEKVLLEAELLELKANPNKHAIGSVIEASLEKGKGYVATVLVQEGTLKMQDMVLAGPYYGKVKAMFDERGHKLKDAGPSTPVQLLGLNGAPQAGEKIRVLSSEQEVKSLANRREQIEREQGLRAQKHITLDEIGRRLALGNFKELNLIIKADFDGSVEALSDSLQKLSTAEIQIRIIHQAVGQITESDVLLATASDAIIVGFQVRPSLNARKIAEKENIEIRLYSIIYDAIEEIKSAMEGMLEPKIEERIVGNIEIREVFKISRIGSVAGCMVLDGKFTRNTKIRVVRDGIVVFTGELSSLKRYKDDIKEVKTNMECGLTVKDYNDIKVGDVIEGYEEVEVKRTL